MRRTHSRDKAARQTALPAQQDASAGPGATALAPPTYGIDFVDQGPANDLPVQRIATSLKGKNKLPGRRIGASGAKRPNDTGLPDRLKAGVERLSGLSMDAVRVRYNSSKPAQVQALAYAQGTDIHVGPGEERHLPHEAWHVVQQMQGRVKPTKTMHGAAINDDHRLEREAEVMGSRARFIKHPPLNERYAIPEGAGPLEGQTPAGAGGDGVRQMRCAACERREELEGRRLPGGRRSVIQRVKDCAESEHHTTYEHRWVQAMYKKHVSDGGKKEYAIKLKVSDNQGGWKDAFRYMDIVDENTCEIFEIKPRGSLGKATEEAWDYYQWMTYTGCQCGNGNWRPGAKRDDIITQDQNTEYAYLTMSFPEDGAIIYEWVYQGDVGGTKSKKNPAAERAERRKKRGRVVEPELEEGEEDEGVREMDDDYCEECLAQCDCE